MSKSESIKEITTALTKAQIAFKPIKRTEKVDYATQSGRKKYNYAPLSEIIEATKQALSDNGLAITQSTKLVEGNVILETLLSHSSGEWLSGELYVGKQDQPPQSEGSALTYKRRYGISAILNVASEDDDDGEIASDKKPEIVTDKIVAETSPMPNLIEKPLTIMNTLVSKKLLTPAEAKELLSKFGAKGKSAKEMLMSLPLGKLSEFTVELENMQPSPLAQEAIKMGAEQIKEVK